MSHLKIFVCTTFRDFKGNENDNIQKKFLESIENQSYSNIELVVTLFGEKKVQEEVEKYHLPSVFFNHSIEGHRYSLTQVVLNGIRYAKECNDSYIILWTTCDIIYDNNFFDKIINHYKQNIMGTSHPHISYSSINNYVKKINNEKSKLFSGFDLIYFDNFFLETNQIINTIETYTFNDWGVFEHFLISLNELNTHCNMINLYEESKIYKIENNRELTNEPSLFLKNSHKNNSKIFNKFLYTEKITNEYFDLAFCHTRFKITKKFLGHYLHFKIDILQMIKRKLLRNRLIRSIINLIPRKIIQMIKGTHT